MNLAEQVLDLHEGGLVKVPVGLQKTVTGSAKHIVMGLVLESVLNVSKQYNNILKSIDKKHPNYDLFLKIIKMLDKYVSSYKAFKPRKSNVRKKKITIKKSDMLPYDVEEFNILLTTSTKYSSGSRGSITIDKGNDGFHSEIPLSINFARIGGTIDTFKSFARNSMSLHMSMRDNKPLSDFSVKMLNDIFPEFKKFASNIRNEMSDSISIMVHELTHVVQHQTGQGYNHKDFNKEGGYIQLKGKSDGAFDKYAVGSKEIKAYLVNQVDDFYKKDFKGLSYSEAVKSFISDRVWFKAFQDDKKRNRVIKDFTIALSKDRRKIKFNLSESVFNIHEEKNSPYMEYEYPISLKDLKSTYKRFNKELFKNQLPDCRLKWASLAKNFYGKYHHKYNDDNTAKDRLITMATTLQKDNKLFEDTLIHEMIHCWQYWMQEKTGDSKYIDHVWFDFETDVHKKGHGPFFASEMKRINRLGYNVTREGDLQIEKELDKPVWAILFNSNSDRGVFVYSVSDPKNKIELIVSSIEEIAGSGFFTSYKIVKTTDTVANTGLRLTKEFLLPKNSKNIYSPSEKIDSYLLGSKLSQIVGGDNLMPKGDLNQSVEPEDTQLLAQMHKWRGNDFKSYLVTFLGNSKKYASIIETDAYKANNWASQLSVTKWKYGKPILGVPKEVIEAVRKDWMNISDIEIKSAFKYVTTEVFQAITSPDKKVSAKYISDIKKKYDSDFKDRVSMDRYKKAYYKVVLSDLKKKHKRYGKVFDEPSITRVLKEIILKGTILENYSVAYQIKQELNKEIY